TAAEIEARMDNQWSDEKKRKLASTVIENLTLSDSKKRVDELHEFLSKGL
ncbi:MAG: dephospho-CoA kinase, partial [Flavobacteriaceae bacterium]|nr:dephospho-CoA kinase [Flavobacteriaceae bacterium]